MPMRHLVVALVWAVSLAATGAGLGAQAPQLIRAISGPSGRVVGNDLVIDDVRDRFVYPQDRSLVVYFEWRVPAGSHVLSATWKQPDGRVAVVSPDVQIQTSGAHTFELAGKALDPLYSLDRIVKTYLPSTVWVDRLDQQGDRIDRSSGFVLAPGVIATAFQSIDAAAALAIEFADGRRVSPAGIAAVSRMGDWALLRADTGQVAPIPRARQGPAVGANVAVFDTSNDQRTAIVSRVLSIATPAGYPPRMLLRPGVEPAAVGGPVISEDGSVVGMVGASLTPGSRPDPRVPRPLAGAEVSGPADTSGAILLADVPEAPPLAVTTLGQLAAQGTLTPLLQPTPEFISGGISLTASAGASATPYGAEFSRGGNGTVTVYSTWRTQRNTRATKGTLAVTVYDAANHPHARAAKPVSLARAAQRFEVSFPVQALPVGYYRIDVAWNDAPVWRGYVHIAE
jgi:hypothetical protein